MKSMKAAPVIICRTRKVDYDGFFCHPSDVEETGILTKLRNSIYANDLHLLSGPQKCLKIVICDNTHVIIGRMMIIIDAVGKDCDLQLDHQASSRTLWGFIGAVFKRRDYQSNVQAFDVDDLYYKDVFIDKVYKEHWDDEKFSGPYRTLYEDIPIVEIGETNNPFHNDEYIISSEYNEAAYNYVLSAIHKGNVVSLCTNAEYSASESIFRDYVTYATVNPSRLDKMRYSLNDKKRIETHSKGGSFAVNSKDGFIEQLKELCDSYGVFYEPVRKDGKRGWFIAIDEDKRECKISKILKKWK